MKDIIDFKHMVNDLCSISDCPNFSDEMRDKASDLLFYIKETKPTKIIDELREGDKLIIKIIDAKKRGLRFKGLSYIDTYDLGVILESGQIKGVNYG